MVITFGRDNEARRLEWLRTTLAGLPSGLRVLDAGAGELRNRAFCSHLTYVSQDLCQYEGTGDGSALQTGQWDTTRIDIVSDIVSIPVPDGAFDVVLCTEVLEHLPDPLTAVRELVRLLKTDGRLIITAPFCSLTHFAPHHFSTGLSRYWYEAHLRDAGCEVETMAHNGGWPDFIAQELWRLPWIGRTYTGRILGWAALICALPTLVALRVLKAFDRGSPELLTFGWHVVARKR